ncbi:sensor histidine kinase [Streptomyces sp. AA1529]|uniref:sensor histidine kinase n=1 Tax=Streptomyces sp. AA1529 TaxID=1203257 RepID=UPI003D7461EF
MSGPPNSSIPPLREAPVAAVDTALRRRLVRLTCAPALVVTLVATAAVTFLWFAGRPDAAVPRDAAAPGALAAVLLVAAAALVAGLRAAAAQAAALNRRARPAPPVPPPAPPAPAPAPAVTTGPGVEGGSAPAQRLRPADQVTVFVNLARRLQSLLHREIHVLDELENQVEDPDILKGVFQVDHLATRIRRYTENLAVLGGAVPRRQWTRPVQLTEILRSSAAEVEHYQRVRLVPPIEGTVSGQAVADVIHLLSELVENATFCSPPQTRVLLRTSRVTAGLAIEVEDRGLGMTERTQQRMNALLADPEGVDVGALLADGRIGLYVVGMLARRHGIAVELRGNIYGGVQAVLVLPHALLGAEQGAAGAPGAAAGHAPTAEPRAPQAPLPGAAPPGPAPLGTAPHPRSAPPAAAPYPGSGPPAGPGTPAPTAAVPAPVPGGPLPAAAGQGSPPPGGGERPRLPRRSRQQHLVPELRDAPAAGTRAGQARQAGTAEGTEGAESTEGAEGAEDAVHDPGLMAAFRRGVGRADEAHGRPSPDGHGPPHQEEGRS